MKLTWENIQGWFARYSGWITVAFFALFLVIGIRASADYGLPWDEPLQQEDNGTLAYNYAFHGDKAMFDNNEKYHGQVFEIMLVAIEKKCHITDSSRIYEMRHLVSFIAFFIGCVIFFFLCLEIFKNRVLALLACCMLVLSPRIFADSFFNSKDIPFMSLSVCCIYSLLLFIRKKNLFSAFMLGLSTALFIDVRITGIYMVAITVFFCAIAYFLSKKDKKILINFGAYLVFLVAFIVVFWPVLWADPWQQFWAAYHQMKSYPWPGRLIFAGKIYFATAVPWNYIPVWIAVTTPVLYTALFILGLLGLGIVTFKNIKPAYSTYPGIFVCLLCLFIPLLSVIAMHSVVYDGWRHLFFIYPSFIIIAVFGFEKIWAWIASLSNILARIGFGLLLLGAVLFSFTKTLIFMFRYHPLENVYFSALEPKAEGRYELDYWGVSYAQGLREILKRDTAAKIYYASENLPGQIAPQILTEKERSRLINTDKDKATYFLADKRFNWLEKFDYKDTFYNIKVENNNILTIFKLK